jgi:hypothetical protein
VDRAWPVIVPELRKNFLGWIDMSHAMLPVFYVPDIPSYHAPPHLLIPR